MLIREMNSLDIDSVRAIAKETWRSTYSSFIPEDIQDKILEEAYSVSEMANRLKNSITLVAEENGELIGYAFLTTKRFGNNVLLESLYIHPDFQGRGAGKKLFHTGIAKLPQATTISLTVYKGNPNISFYEKEGFKITNESKGEFFGHPVTFILMEKKVLDS